MTTTSPLSQPTTTRSARPISPTHSLAVVVCCSDRQRECAQVYAAECSMLHRIYIVFCIAHRSAVGRIEGLAGVLNSNFLRPPKSFFSISRNHLVNERNDDVMDGRGGSIGTSQVSEYKKPQVPLGPILGRSKKNKK